MIRKWVLYSTLLGIFCSRFFIMLGGLTLFYFYFVVAINFVLLAIMGYTWFPSRLRLFVGYLFCSGVLGLVLGTNSSNGFLKSWIGISLCACYSAAFLRFVRFDAVNMFRQYAKFAFLVAIFGIVFLPFQGYPPGRLVSVFREPSGFAIVCVPAVFYYADQWQRHRRYGMRLIVIFIACILTFSSLGFLGMMLGAFLFGMRYRVGRVVVPFVVVLAFALAWSQSRLFQMKIGDTLSGLRNNDIRSINASSFGVVANVLITQKQLMAHPLLGGGLGSHVVAHERFLDSLPGAFLLPDDLRTLGQWDASSLMLRIISELGIVGVVGAFWFLIHYFPRQATEEERAISMALLCYVFMKFCRSGEYFGPEQYFFLSIYTIVGAQAWIRVRTRNAAAALRARTAAVETGASGASGIAVNPA